MNESTQNNAPERATARARTSGRTKPVSQLLATLLVLFAHVSLAVIVIGLIKVTFDRRLDQSLVAETLADAIDRAERGNAGEAEKRVVAIIEERARLQEPLAWGLADYFVVMPELTRRLSPPADANRQWNSDSPLHVDAALRTDNPIDSPATLQALHTQLPRAYAFLAATELPDFAVVRTLSDPSKPIDPSALPPTALPRTASPLAFLTPVRNGVPRVLAPSEIPESLRDYYLGAVAFYQGRLAQAKQFLTHDWERNHQRADTAYLLGAIAETQGDKDAAREWYGRALGTEEAHLPAARAFVRMGLRD